MLTEPKIVEWSEQPYMGVRASVPMEGIAGFIDGSFPEVFARLEAENLEPADAPFLRYNVIDMEGLLEIEVGVPVVRTRVSSTRTRRSSNGLEIGAWGGR